MTPAETQLLFGLIALQVGLITQAQLIVAFQAWTRDKSRLLADHLADGGAIGPDARAAVEAMVALHLRQHGGDAGRSLAAIPGEPSTLRRLAGLGDADLTASVTPTGRASATTPTELDPESTATFAFGDRPVDGQRYRILRHHASGGLGAVYVAHNSELGREVALKQILGRSADDPDSRQRFLLEAQVTGGLEHPGIVPVYGLGADADGRPYYAMRFIRGDSLKEAIERFHRDAGGTPDPADRALALRGLLRRFVDVCNAIEYAHGRGVLHRDIKPGNIILGTHGETLVVDWGLAKPVGRSEPGGPGDERTLRPSSASGSAETQPGSAIGTPAYMSPEQASGAIERLGPRSDVYSLGATLYCLIAGRAPFEGPVPAVLEKVRAGEFSLPRQVAPATDRALEAVCLKALARREEDRYPSARALADDVERWLADQPVTAMRDPLFTRAWRGIRRHRTAATTAAAVALVGLIALAVGNRQLSSANARTERWLDQAMASYEDYVSGFNEHAITGGRLPEDLVESLLAKPRQFYERLSAELAASASPTARERMMLARSRANLGRILSLLGRNAEARSEHEASARLWEGLARDWPGEPEYHAGRAAAANSLAKIFQTTGQASEAEEAYARAVAAYEELVRSQPGDDDHRDGLGWALSGRAEVLSAAGRNPEAIELLRRAIEVREGVVERRPAAADHQYALAVGSASLGRLLHVTGRPAEARQAYARSIVAYEALVGLRPDSVDDRDGLAWASVGLADLQAAAGETGAAVRSLERAVALRLDLVQQQSNVPAFRYGLAQHYDRLAYVLNDAGRHDEALAANARAISAYEDLVREHRDVPDYASGLAASYSSLGRILSTTGRSAEATPAFARSVAAYEALARLQPSSLNALDGLA